MIRRPCAGIMVKTPEGNKVCRAVLLCATLDLPAKAAVTNTKQWNGEYGCSVCLHKGPAKVRTLGNGHTTHHHC